MMPPTPAACRRLHTDMVILRAARFLLAGSCRDLIRSEAPFQKRKVHTICPGDVCGAGMSRLTNTLVYTAPRLRAANTRSVRGHVSRSRALQQFVVIMGIFHWRLVEPETGLKAKVYPGFRDNKTFIAPVFQLLYFFF